MQKLWGLLILGGGLALLASENTPSSREREEQLAAITRIVARATIIEPETVAAEQPGLRRPVTSPAASYVTPSARVALPGPASTSDARDAQRVAVAAPQTTTLPAVSVPVMSIPRSAADAPPPSSLSIQRQLARQIQSELKRVGCYSGRLDGSWGDRSRSAMIEFMSRVNASLPTYEPDVFLLSLIKGQQQPVCGPACGSDEVQTAGRCIGRSNIAENRPAARDASPAVIADASPAVATSHPEPLPGRMSIGGPVAVGPAAPAPITEPITEWTAPAAERLPLPSKPPAAPPAAEMAALEPGLNSDAAFANPPVPRKITKVKRVSSAPAKPQKRRFSSRAVEQLFMHPLGRM